MPNLLTMFDAKQWIKGSWHAWQVVTHEGELAPRASADAPTYADEGVDKPCNGMCAMGFIHYDLGGAIFKAVVDDYKFDPYNYSYKIPTSMPQRVNYFRNILRAVGEIIAGEVFDAWAETHSDKRVYKYCNRAVNGEEEHARMLQHGYLYGSEQIVNFNDSEDTPEEDIRDFFEALMDKPRYEDLRRLVRMPDEQLIMYAEGYLNSASADVNVGSWYAQTHYKQLIRANVI